MSLKKGILYSLYNHVVCGALDVKPLDKTFGPQSDIFILF